MTLSHPAVGLVLLGTYIPLASLMTDKVAVNQPAQHGNVSGLMELASSSQFHHDLVGYFRLQHSIYGRVDTLFNVQWQAQG